jgi:hypothetical protein
MGVDGLKVEFASDQEQNGLDGGEPDEASSASFGGLEQSVDSLQKAVGLTGLGPSDDAFEMAAYHRGDLFHGLDLGAHDASAPMAKGLAHDIDLPPIEDLAQLLFIDPGPCGAGQFGCGDQNVQRRSGMGVELEDVLEQCPSKALKRGFGSLLAAPSLIHGLGTCQPVLSQYCKN